jgi:surface antigen
MSETRNYIRPAVTGAAAVLMALSFATVAKADTSKAVENAIDVTAILSLGNVARSSTILKDTGPVLNLKASEVTVNNGDVFNPESFITFVQDDSGILPALKTTGSVDMSTDGVYTVGYKAVGLDGRTAEKTLAVTVKTPQEVLDAEAEEQAKAQKEAEEEAARQAEEAARLAAETAQLGGAAPGVTGGVNPYGGGWSNCTWGAWQLAYQKLGVSLPSWGYAGSWYASAAASGYAVGQEPRGNAIAVYSGHVAFVDSASGSTAEIEEGGYMGGYNHRVVPSDSDGYQPLIGYIYL